jgi:phospholipid/cholesterol/gamma-HCH transport system permease protein
MTELRPEAPPDTTPIPLEPGRPSLDIGFDLPPLPPAPDRSFLERRGLALLSFMGATSTLFARSLRVLLKRPLELREIVLQLEQIGVKSTGLVIISGTFVGMVMALQFALGLQKFGGMEYTGRVISLSFTRELAPALTAVIVGGRIGGGIAAEIGSMAVTEQIDAIRALGADPVKKLVMPRLVASVIVMPVVSMISLVLGFCGAMLVAQLQFDLPAGFFLSSALDSVTFPDFWNGFLKTPVFGAIIALVGCHFGLETSGGTQGVGRATTNAVVATTISLLVADFLLTNVFAVLIPK